MSGRPAPGDLLRVDRRASVQFSDDQALVFRVLKVDPKPTYHGWVWLTGYVLDQRGEAVERREIFVQLAGLVRLRESPPVGVQPVRASGPRSGARPAARPRTARPLDQAAVHRARTYPQLGSLV